MKTNYIIASNYEGTVSGRVVQRCIATGFNGLMGVISVKDWHVYILLCITVHVDREWVNEVGFFLFFLNPVWLVCYAHVFHVLGS